MGSSFKETQLKNYLFFINIKLNFKEYPTARIIFSLYKSDISNVLGFTIFE